MSNYNYELNTLFGDISYDDLLEVYNKFNMENSLNESVMSIPKNKIKDILKKITTIKDDNQMEKFVNKHKKFVKPHKELKNSVMKLAKQLNFEEKEIEEVNNSISKILSVFIQSSILIAVAGIPLLITIMINSIIKKVSIKEVAKTVLDDLKTSIHRTKKGHYTSALNFTFYGIIFLIQSFILSFLALSPGFIISITTSITGGFFFVGLVLFILGLISFMWTFLGTPERLKETK